MWVLLNGRGGWAGRGKMKEFGLVLVIVLLGLVLLAAPSVMAHQTSTPHFYKYTCEVVDGDLACTIEFHHPDSSDWDWACPHTVGIKVGSLVDTQRYMTSVGCNMRIKVRPVPAEGVTFAAVRVRDLQGTVIKSVWMKWGPSPTPTPTPAPTPTPQPAPRFTGYTCRGFFSTVKYCKAYMYVPEGYNEPYQGDLHSDYVVLFGSEYDQETRVWTLEAWYQLPYNWCGEYAHYTVHETRTGRLLDEFRLVSPCR